MDNPGLSARPSLRQLEYWSAVAEHRHFGRAADACGVTQPGLSAQILELESMLGISLFERSRRGVLPTPECERLLPLARAALRSVDELVLAARDARDPFSGDLRLGVIPTIAPYLLPRALPEVRRRHERLRCILVEDQTERLLTRLRAGSLDLVLAALPLDGEDLTQRALYSEPFVVAVRSDDPLARRPNIRPQDLSGREVLLLEDGH